MKPQDENKNGTIVSQNGTSKPAIRLIRTLESYANIDYTFDESLVPNGIFREVYDYIKDRSDVPEQFIFTSVLAMFCGIVGNRISLKRRVWKFKPHDYFILMAGSGRRKTTMLNKMKSILSKLEEKVADKENPHNNVFLYPYSDLYPRTAMLKELLDLMCEKSDAGSIFLYPKYFTSRGLLDLMCDRSDAEVLARTVTKKKSKAEPPPKVVQRSGVAIIDHVSELFFVKSASNSVRLSTLIDLWDGKSTSFATSLRTGGVRRFKDTALTVLSADIPEVFVERLPKAYLDLILSRFQIINAEVMESRKTLGQLIWEYQEYRDEIKKRYNDILEKLKQFYQFVCSLSQSQAPVLVSDEALSLHKQSVRMWREERDDLEETTSEYMTETIGRYMSRVEVRNVRYTLLFSILECFDRHQHGQSVDAITLTGTAMQKAIEVCELYKKHTLHFLVKAKALRPRLFKFRRSAK